MYSWLKVIKQPLARPLMNRPAYNGPILSVAIMMMLEIQHSAQASHKHCLRPSLMAMNPAPPELMNAPSVMSEEISCWRSVLMFHPIGDFGALKPKTYYSFQVAINFSCRRETYLEKAFHGLQATDQPKINSILEGSQDHDSTREEHSPIGDNCFRVGDHHLACCPRRPPWVVRN